MHPVLERDYCKIAMLEQGTIAAGDPQDPQPARMGLPLKPHQLAALRRMREMEEGGFEHEGQYTVSTTLGLLCDKVGSGKSIEVLARICQAPDLAPRPVQRRGVCLETVNIAISTVPLFEPVPSNLIVVPHGIVAQWQEYVQKHTPLSLTVVQRKAQVPAADWEPTAVLLCSSTMCRPLAQRFEGAQFSRVVIDECTTIQLPRCPVLRGCFHWLVSSSVHSVLFPSGSYFAPQPGLSTRVSRRFCDRVARTGFVRNILGHLENFPSVAPLFLRCQNEFVDASFALPPPVHTEHLCRPPACLSLVEGIASDEITRMLHAGDIDGALQMLPCPRGSADNLISRLTADLDNRLERQRARLGYYRQILAGSGLEDAQRQHFEERRTEVAARVAQLETQREVVVQRLSRCDAEACPVCLERPAAGRAAITGCCKHVFCAGCLQRALALQRRCPYCRESIAEDSMLIITPPAAGGGEPEPERDRRPTKVEAVLRLLEEAERGAPGRWRFLVFSNYESFGKLQAALGAAGIAHGKLCGSGPCIRKQVAQFEARTTPVLMLNASYYGAGLNLQTATDVVLMHKMDADMESQVVGRAQRVGRPGALRVHKLRHPGE